MTDNEKEFIKRLKKMKNSIDLQQGDCLELMKDIPDESVDMILCDLPYGMTANSWDVVIPFDKLWKQYKRIIKRNGCVALFGKEPFSSELRLSNKNMYRYDWVINKSIKTGFLNAKKMPLRKHELISIFYKNLPVYNPQYTYGKPYVCKKGPSGSNYNEQGKDIVTVSDGRRYPVDVLDIKWSTTKSHPTEKPVSLLEYLIKTYTNEGMTVLDNCMGSGSTGIACVNTNRNFIGMELDEEYFKIAKERINNE